MNRDMWKIIRTAQVAVVALLLTVSCTKNPIDGGGAYDTEYVECTIELQPPGGYTPAETRAMDGNQQNAITRAMVIVYWANGGRISYYEEVKVTDGKFIINLRTSESESKMFDIVVIGNPPSDYDLDDWQYKSYLQESLISPVTGKWTGTEFMMWGEQNNVHIKRTKPHFKIEMLRSLARIDVGAGVYNPTADRWAGLADFDLTEVRVVNRRDKFAVVPKPENLYAGGKLKVTAPSVPEKKGSTSTVIGKTAGDALLYSGTDIRKGTANNGAYINSTIFVAEAKNEPGERMTLIIGGMYKGMANYYRVDMCMPKAVGEGYDYLPILRNYRYRVTITGISGAGAPTPEQALAAPPTNILTTLEPISESEIGGDIIFDGDNYITTDVSEVQIYGAPDGVSMYNLFTVTAGTKAGATTTGTVKGAYISDPLTLTNGVSQLVAVPIPADERPYVYTVTFGTLQKEIRVTVKAPLEGFATVLPFTDVASITIDGGGDWLTLSHNETYVQGEQKLGFIEGDAQDKAYTHLSENLSSRDATRTAKAIVKHNNSRGTTCVILEQRENEIVGYFGGDPTNTMTGEGAMYPKQLVVASAEIRNTMYKTDMTGNASSIVNSIYYGRNMNIAAAALSGAETLANYPAFEYCASLNKDTNNNGKIDDAEMNWYLPSQNQLMVMWVFNDGLDIPFGSQGYWSATQHTINSELVCNAFHVSFHNGNPNHDYGKPSPIRVRCVKDI